MSALTTPLAGGALPEPAASPVETIRTVLKRDIAAILRDHLPALAMVPRDKVYDRVLDDPALLHQAFTLFRARPDLFKEVIRTPEAAVPSSDGDSLWCGRTLAEGIALVVRACARRYFRRRLAAPRPRRHPAPQPGLWAGLALSLGLAAPARPARPSKGLLAAAGERLYQAFRDLLLYDWQVPLIPAYAALEPHVVTQLGPRILEFRDSARLHVLTDPVAAHQVVQGKVPLMLDTSPRLMVPDGSGINAEVLWTLSQKMQVARLFPEWDTNEMRRAVSMVSVTAPAALAALEPALGKDVRAFTLFLFTAYGKLGQSRYKQVFGVGGQTWVVRALAERARREPPLAPSLDQTKLAMERLLDGAALDEIKPPSPG